jgi:hypothetical protein
VDDIDKLSQWDEKPFTKAVHIGTIASVLASIDHQAHGLAQYTAAFENAQIDVELALHMTVRDMCLLLPDAPLGHCLRLHQILSRLAEREPDIPDSACWRVRAKQIRPVSFIPTFLACSLPSFLPPFL